MNPTNPIHDHPTEPTDPNDRSRARRRRPRRLLVAAGGALALVGLSAATTALLVDGSADVPTPAVVEELTGSTGMPAELITTPGEGGEKPTTVTTIAPVPSTTVAPQPPPPGPPEPPGPAPLMAGATSYLLDPGIHQATIVVENHGDADLHYEVANDGHGFTVTSGASGTIEPAAGAEIDVVLAVNAEPPGPTAFTRVVHVDSDGGALVVTIDGQVETPGQLAVAGVTPIVDYRATVELTNDGELPVEITGLTVPGMRWGPLPDKIGPGETVEIELAICAADLAALPVAAPIAPAPTMLLQTTMVVDSTGGTVGIALTGTSIGLDPPSCQPVVDPGPGGLTLGG